MSALTVTCSPGVRGIANRPPSISGTTASMITRGTGFGSLISAIFWIYIFLVTAPGQKSYLSVYSNYIRVLQSHSCQKDPRCANSNKMTFGNTGPYQIYRISCGDI